MPAPTQPDDRDELAHADDAVIGRAFRVSAVLLGVLALAGGGFWVWQKTRPRQIEIRKTELSIPNPANVTAARQVPDARFTDVTGPAGITFKHFNGAYGDKLLPETMGGGVAFFDYDNDDRPDLLFVNSAPWPWRRLSGSVPTMALYHNDGGGHFTDVTRGSGLDVAFYGMGVTVGDYDNDGRTDVFLSGVGGGRLFHNEGAGRFREVTGESGVAGDPTDWSTAAAFFDYDNDGRLDLFVGSYVKWSKEIDLEVGYKLVGVGRAYGQPMNFQGAFPRLYHNEGSGKFRDVAAAAGLHVKNKDTGVPLAKTLGVAPVDLDGDGWMDLVLANDTVQNFVFHNERNGTFKEIGVESYIAFDVNGAARGAMGIDTAFFRNDTALGIAIGNFANEMTALYVSQREPLSFADEAIPEGIGPASRLPLKFGVFFFDYDLDGRLDLLSCNGHLEEEISKIQKSQKYAQSAQLFWNCGAKSGANFVPVNREHAGPDLFTPIVGRGSAYADFDGDGDPDVVLTQIGGPPLLLRNDQRLGHHWLRLKLAGTKSNRSAIGARVIVKAGGHTLTRVVMPTKSYLSQSELPVTFGLADTAGVDSVEIVWPGGVRQTNVAARVDALTTVEEPR